MRLLSGQLILNPAVNYEGHEEHEGFQRDVQASIFTRWVRQVSANLISISLFFFVIFVVNRSF